MRHIIEFNVCEFLLLLIIILIIFVCNPLDPHQKVKRKRKRCSSESEIVLKKFKESANEVQSTSENKELTIKNLILPDTKSSCNSKLEQTEIKASCDSKVEQTDTKASYDSKMDGSDTKVNCDSKIEQPEIKTSQPLLQTVEKMATVQDKVEVNCLIFNEEII